MTSENIRAFTRAEPFKPFRVTLTTGESFHVARPDQAMTASGMVYLHPDTSRSPEWAGVSAIHLQLSEIARIEPFEIRNAIPHPRKEPPMTAENIQEFTRAQPFVAVRVTLMNGEEFDIAHPDMMAGGQMACILRPARPGTPSRFVFASLLQVQKIEHLTAAAAPPVDRSTV